MRNYVQKPPKNTRWIIGNHHLSQDHEQAAYRVSKPDGTNQVFVAAKRKRQVVEALRQSPLYCASPIRIGHYVDVLREELGEGVIATDWMKVTKPFPNECGIYRLVWPIEQLERKQ